MVSKSPALYALGKWLSGTGINTYIHDLDVEWIRDFNPNEFDDEESYIAEWRVGAKPKTGWDVFDVKIFEVSSSKKVLKKRMKELEEADEKADSDGSGSGKDKEKEKEKEKERQKEREEREEREREEREREERDKETEKKKERRSSDSELPKDMVLLGKKLCITKTQHICALAAPTASSMTMGLTRAGFSVRRRIISNYAGQSRNGVTKKSLKVYQKMRDIQDFVLKRFPNMSQSSFSSAVNAVCAKRAEKEKQPPEYKDTSSDSE